MRDSEVSVMNTRAYAIDLKTTSRDATEAQPIEIGIVEVYFENGVLVIDEPIVERCKPDNYISFDVMARTNITNEDVFDLEPSAKVMRRMMPVGYSYIIGHNLGFHLQVAKSAGVDIAHYKPICTLALARYFMPNADNYNLATLSYMLDYAFTKKHAHHAANAGFDAMFCARLLRELCKLNNIYSMERLLAVSRASIIPTHFNFGKHNGKSIASMAKTTEGIEYLEWVVRTVKTHPAIVDACKKALEGDLPIASEPPVAKQKRTLKRLKGGVNEIADNTPRKPASFEQTKGMQVGSLQLDFA